MQSGILNTTKRCLFFISGVVTQTHLDTGADLALGVAALGVAVFFVAYNKIANNKISRT